MTSFLSIVYIIGVVCVFIWHSHRVSKRIRHIKNPNLAYDDSSIQYKELDDKSRQTLKEMYDDGLTDGWINIIVVFAILVYALAWFYTIPAHFYKKYKQRKG